MRWFHWLIPLFLLFGWSVTFGLLIWRALTGGN